MKVGNKSEYQSRGSVNAQKKRQRGASRTRPTAPAWQERSSVANLKRSKKQKRKSQRQ